MPSDIEIGKVVNHTRRLEIGEIREIVQDLMEAHRSEGRTVHVEPVHVAPADDATLMTKAARAWRDSTGNEAEFQETISGRLFWFGLRYTIEARDEEPLDDEVPDQWPPEGDEADVGDQPDPRIADQLDIEDESTEA